MRWRDYMKLRGGTNLGLRLESGFALVAMAVNRSVGGKATIDDFTPHMRDEDTGLMSIFSKIGGGKDG